MSHLGRQELGLARKHLQAAVELKPSYVAARLALAAACDLLARHEEAVEQIDAVLVIESSKTDRAALACAAGFCLERVGRPADASLRYEEALAHDPEGMDLFAHYRLAAIHLAKSDLEKAATHHKAILEI